MPASCVEAIASAFVRQARYGVLRPPAFTEVVVFMVALLFWPG
jgi:hypothetical protein